MNQLITENQYKSLVDKISFQLMACEGVGMGEIGGVRDSAEYAVKEWVEETGIKISSEGEPGGSSINTRKIALEWWESLSESVKNELNTQYFGVHELTDDNIHSIWEWEETISLDSSIGELDGKIEWDKCKKEAERRFPMSKHYNEEQEQGVERSRETFLSGIEYYQSIASAPALKKENDRLKGKFDPAPLPEKYTRWDLYMMLYNLTPGGSEFALDPKACADWVTEQRNSIPSTVKALKQENERLREQVAEYINLLKLAYGSLETFTESEAWEEHSDGITLSAIEKAIESNTK